MILMLTICTTKSQTLMDETFAGTSLPTGWSISSTATNPDEQWTFYDLYDDIELNESSTVAQNEWLFLPNFNLQSYSEMYFNFSLWMYSKSSYTIAKSCKASIMISINNGTSWEELWNTDILNTNEFDGDFLFDRMWSINLSEYCGAGKPDVKLAIKYTSNGTKPGNTFSPVSFAALRRVNISGIPMTSFSNLNKNVLNWYPVSGYNGTYDIYYGPLGTTTGKAGGTLVSGVTGTSFTIPENYCQYTAFIRANKGTPGEWVKLDFLNTVDNMAAAPTLTSAQITWTGDADLYDLEYGVGNFTVGNGTRINNISGTNYNLTTLMANTNYKVFVKASCNAASWRNITFVTTPLGTEETGKRTMKIYPNPSSDVIHFSEEINSFKIFDINGRIVKSLDHPTEKIDISKLPIGNYTVSGKAKSGEKFSQKIIKK